MRASNSTSIRSAGPEKTPIELPKTSSGRSRVLRNVSSDTERRSMRSTAKVRNSPYAGTHAMRYTPPCASVRR